jgi:hypothetical protein
VAQLLSRFQADPTPSRVRKAVQEGEAAQVMTFTGTAAGDPRRLRGLPAIGPNMAGEIWHTRPDREVLRLDDR